MRDKNADFLKQGSILAMASLIVRFIGMIYRIPMSNILGDDGNGIYAVAFDIYDIVLIVSSYSLPLALSKLISEQTSKRQFKNVSRTFKCALTFALISGAVFGGLLFALSTYIETHIYPGYEGLRYPLRVLAPTVFIVAILGTFRGFFQGKSTMIPTAVSQVLEQIVNAVVSIVAPIILMKTYATSEYKSAWGAAGGTMGTCAGAFSALLLVIFVFIIYRPIQKKLERRDIQGVLYPKTQIYKMLILTILPVILSQTVYQISGLVDYYMFGDLMGSKGVDALTIRTQIGTYSSKYRLLTSLPIAISTSIASSMIPSAVAAFTTGDTFKLKKNINMAVKFNIILAFPCALAYTVLGHGIVRMLFPSHDYISGGNMLLFGATAVIFYAVSNVTGGALQSIDKMRIPVINSAISLGIHVVLIFLLLKFTGMGIYAIVLGNVLFPVCVSILNVRCLKKYIEGFRIDIKKMGIVPLAASLWMAVGGLLTYILFNGIFSPVSGYVANFIGIFFALIVSVVIYFVLFFKLKGITEEELLDFPMGGRIRKVAAKFNLI